jgi:hypothetical protein
MISQKKLEANRLNSQKSTGPKTPEGKERSSQNGLTHGLTSKKYPILPGENEAEYEQFHNAMVRDLKPRGIMQYQIVQDLIQVRWRMNRLPQIEAESMRRRQQKLQEHYDKYRKCNKKIEPPNLDPIQLLTDALDTYGSCSSNIDLYRQRLQREMQTLLRELRKLREETGVEEDAVEMLPCDTGLDSTELAEVRPVQTQQEVCEERSCKTEPTGHEPVARVTGEQQAEASEDVICKTEPTAEPTLLQYQEKEIADMVPPIPLNAEPAGIQSLDSN